MYGRGGKFLDMWLTFSLGIIANHLNKCHSELGQDFRTTLVFFLSYPVPNLRWLTSLYYSFLGLRSVYDVYYYLAYRLLYMKCHWLFIQLGTYPCEERLVKTLNKDQNSHKKKPLESEVQQCLWVHAAHSHHQHSYHSRDLWVMAKNPLTSVWMLSRVLVEHCYLLLETRISETKEFQAQANSPLLLMSKIPAWRKQSQQSSRVCSRPYNCQFIYKRNVLYQQILGIMKAPVIGIIKTKTFTGIF